MKELDRYISYIDYFQIDNVARKYIFSKTKEEIYKSYESYIKSLFDGFYITKEEYEEVKANIDKFVLWRGRGWYDYLFIDNEEIENKEIPVLADVREIIKLTNPFYNIDYELFIDTEEFIKDEKVPYSFVFPAFGVAKNKLILKYVIYSDEFVNPLDFLESKGIKPYAFGVNSTGEWANFFYFELGDATVTDSCKWEYFIQKYDESNEVKCFFNEGKGVDK